MSIFLGQRGGIKRQRDGSIRENSEAQTPSYYSDCSEQSEEGEGSDYDIGRVLGFGTFPDGEGCDSDSTITCGSSVCARTKGELPRQSRNRQSYNRIPETLPRLVPQQREPKVHEPWISNSVQELFQQRSLLNRRLLHQILPSPTNERTSEIYRFLDPNRFTNQLVIFSFHSDHFHVLHDCPWVKSFCNCRGFGELKPFIKRERRVRRPFWIAGEKLDSFIAAIAYQISEQEGRQIVYCHMPGYKGRFHSEIRDLQDLQCETSIPTGLVETCGVLREDGDWWESYAYQVGKVVPTHEKSVHRGNEFVQREDGVQRVLKEREIEDMIRDFPVAPLNEIVNTKRWLNDINFRYIRSDNPKFMRALDAAQWRFLDMSLMEYVKYFGERQDCLFTNIRNRPDYYYSLNDSYKVLKKLLLFQYENDDNVAIFVNCLIDVIDRRIPKRNCFYVISPPSSGKNFFFDPLLHFFIMFGQIANFNKSQQFPLGSCVNKRILMWNEPNIEPCAFDTVKMVLGGDTCSVNVKYKNNGTLARSPVIMLSNKEVLGSDVAWKHRVYKTTWRPAPFLKQCGKKPHPFGFLKLFAKYTTDVTLKNEINKYFQ